MDGESSNRMVCFFVA